MAGQRTRPQRGSNADPQGAWKQAFLDALTELKFVAHAAQAAGVHRATVYNHLKHDEAFAAQVAEVEAQITADVEREIYRRGVEGVDEPVFYKGDQVGEVRRYSDRMLEMLAKARAPEKYRDNIKVEHGGRIDAGVELVGLDDPEERRKALQLVRDALPGDAA